MMQSITPVLRVSDYARAKEYYVGILGFDCVEEAGDPVVGFGIFRRDRARIFLTAWDGAEAPYDGWRAYIHVTNLSAMATGIVAAGGRLSKAPHLTEYGMEEFEVTDPDGNVIAFGADP